MRSLLFRVPVVYDRRPMQVRIVVRSIVDTLIWCSRVEKRDLSIVFRQFPHIQISILRRLRLHSRYGVERGTLTVEDCGIIAANDVFRILTPFTSELL